MICIKEITTSTDIIDALELIGVSENEIKHQRMCKSKANNGRNK